VGPNSTKMLNCYILLTESLLTQVEVIYVRVK
jgi:hypothetical protein